MSDDLAGGASLAWRLLASLEAGSLLLATSALLAYAARPKAARKPAARDVNTVLVTNVTSTLGVEIKKRLELRGCTVGAVAGDGASGASGASGAGGAQVDALVVVGARGKGEGLDALAGLVSQDVYDNLKLLETWSRRVRAGGRVAWAGAGPADGAGAYSPALVAFDNVLKAALEHTASESQCDAVWVDRCSEPHAAAERLVAALLAEPAEETCAGVK